MAYHYAGGYYFRRPARAAILTFHNLSWQFLPKHRPAA